MEGKYWCQSELDKKDLVTLLISISIIGPQTLTVFQFSLFVFLGFLRSIPRNLCVYETQVGTGLTEITDLKKNRLLELSSKTLCPIPKHLHCLNPYTRSISYFLTVTEMTLLVSGYSSSFTLHPD